MNSRGTPYEVQVLNRITGEIRTVVIDATHPTDAMVSVLEQQFKQGWRSSVALTSVPLEVRRDRVS